MYAIISNNVVIDLLEKFPIKKYPPNSKGEEILIVACDKEVEIGMTYYEDTKIFANLNYSQVETAEQIIRRAVNESFGYYDGYLAAQCLLGYDSTVGSEMFTRAMEIRPMLVNMATGLSDDEALKVPELFDEWGQLWKYEIGDRVKHNNILYKCLQAHAPQESWAPDVSPSLWVRIDNPSEEWPAWRQPSGSTEAYTKGDKVTHNSEHWVSEVDNNVWEPGEYGWIKQ